MRNLLRSVARSAAGLGDARASILVITIAYGVFAISLIGQPARWSATPAYKDLLIIMPARPWGACFAAVTILLAGTLAVPRRRWLSVTALSAALAITLTWCAAFMVRWATSTNTTPETWVSWAVFAYLLLRALIAGEVRVPSRRNRRTGHG